MECVVLTFLFDNTHSGCLRLAQANNAININHLNNLQALYGKTTIRHFFLAINFVKVTVLFLDHFLTGF